MPTASAGPEADATLVTGHPALVVDADDAEVRTLLPALVAGLPYWRALGLRPSLLVVGSDPPAFTAAGVHVVRRDAVTRDALARLCALADGCLVMSCPTVMGHVLRAAFCLAGPPHTIPHTLHAALRRASDHLDLRSNARAVVRET